MRQTLKTHSRSNDLTRRSVLAGVAATLAATSMPAAAMSTGQAEALILKVTTEVQSVINSGKSESAMIRDFEGIFDRYANVRAIAGTVLGPPWRGASGAEQSAYVNAFKGYLARKYGKRFREFQNAKIKVTNSKDFGNKGIFVQSIVSTSVYAPFPVEWHVVDRGGKLEFFDLSIEGVKLISTERTEIRALLNQNGGSVGKLATALSKLG